MQEILPSSAKVFGFVHQRFQSCAIGCRLYDSVILKIEDDEGSDDLEDEIRAFIWVQMLLSL